MDTKTKEIKSYNTSRISITFSYSLSGAAF